RRWSVSGSAWSCSSWTSRRIGTSCSTSSANEAFGGPRRILPLMAIPRRKSRTIKVGWVEVGGDAPVRVQSMTTTKTADVNATLQQMASLVATGVDIVRVAVPHWQDAEALKTI